MGVGLDPGAPPKYPSYCWCLGLVMIDEPYFKNGLFMKERLPFIGFSGVIVDHDRGSYHMAPKTITCWPALFKSSCSRVICSDK